MSDAPGGVYVHSPDPPGGKVTDRITTGHLLRSLPMAGVAAWMLKILVSRGLIDPPEKFGRLLAWPAGPEFRQKVVDGLVCCGYFVASETLVANADRFWRPAPTKQE